MNDPKAGVRPTDKKTLVEEGTKFKGTLSSSCPIVVRGTIEGEITGPSLVVSASGSVSGVVKVDEIQSEGELAGEYDAHTVQLSGTIKDKTVIRAKSLEVKLSPERGKLQVIFGEVELDVGDAPSKDDAIREAKSKNGRNGASIRPEAIASNGEGSPEDADDEDNDRPRRKRPAASA